MTSKYINFAVLGVLLIYFFGFFNIFFHTRNKESEADAVLCGRSMVEMLGVLAIIGVLSIGAISGYSKAMFKYKLNKNSEQLTWLLNTVIRYSSSWKFSQRTNLIPYLVRLTEIPQEMIETGKNNFVYDIFGNKISLVSINNRNEIDIYLDSSKADNDSLDICRNIINTAKEFHEYIIYISAVNYGSSEESSETASTFSFKGDSLCNGKSMCLKNANLEQIEQFCRFNTNQTNQPHIEILTY